MNVQDFGGQGPTLVLLHANGFPSQTLLPLATALSKSFHIVAIDMPGHGDSPAMESGWTPIEMAARIFRTISEHGLIGSSCFGHSFGGSMALLIEAEVNPGTF